MILPQICIFVKTYLLVLRGSVLEQPENTDWLHSKVHIFKVHSVWAVFQQSF